MGSPTHSTQDYDRGSDTGFDRRHIFNVSYIYNLPWFTKSSNVLARTVLGGWSISGITVFERGVPLLVRYTGSDVLGLDRRYQPSEPGITGQISQDICEVVQHRFLCRSSCSVGWRPEPGLWQCRQGFGRGTGNPKLEYLVVQVHSDHSRRVRTSTFALSPSTPSTTLTPKALTSTTMTETLERSPAITVHVPCNSAASLCSEL